MEEILKQILSEIQGIKVRIGNLEEGQKKLEEGQKSLEEGQKNLEEGQKSLLEGQKRLEERQEKFEQKLDAVYNQTAELTEFRTETRQNFQDIRDNIRFLMHKEMETEKEIFLLKDKKNIK